VVYDFVSLAFLGISMAIVSLLMDLVSVLHLSSVGLKGDI
jgi:hypothetical protein